MEIINVIMAALFLLVILYLVAQVFMKPIKLLWKLLFNSAVGLILLLVVNYIAGYFSFSLPTVRPVLLLLLRQLLLTTLFIASFAKGAFKLTHWEVWLHFILKKMPGLLSISPPVGRTGRQDFYKGEAIAFYLIAQGIF
jgi:pro-sigmaK processing inhibitor BofA